METRPSKKAQNRTNLLHLYCAGPLSKGSQLGMVVPENSVSVSPGKPQHVLKDGQSLSRQTPLVLTGGKLKGFLRGRLKTNLIPHTVVWSPPSLVQTQDRAPEVLDKAT